MNDALSELQKDALMETFNIGVGHATLGLSQLTGSDIAMSVPVLIQASAHDVHSIVAPQLFTAEDVFAVTRRVYGVDSDAVLIFQATEQSMAKANHELSLFKPSSRTTLREAISMKIGQIVSESCVTEIERLMGSNISRAPVKFHPHIPADVFADNYEPSSGATIVKIDIRISKLSISAHFLFSITNDAVKQLANGLDRMTEIEDC